MQRLLLLYQPQFESLLLLIPEKPLLEMSEASPLVQSSATDQSQLPTVSSRSNLGPSRQSSPIQYEAINSEPLPSNVSQESQLASLPDEVKSGNPVRPLLHIDEDGTEFSYHLQPMRYSVINILLVELFERFSFYGINYTQTLFLTGAYDSHWNADLTSVEASTYVSVSVAVAYSTPFIGALLADYVLGDYWTLFVGAICFYIPGLVLIVLTSIPGALGETFNHNALAMGLLVLWPIGTGVVKSVVNVFGAKQFHPLLQSRWIEAYYVKFYMCINIGALVGGIVVPILAQVNVTAAYLLPVIMLSLGVLLFLVASKRYVIAKPKWDRWKGNVWPWKSSAKNLEDSFDDDGIPLWSIFRICVLIIPFSIAYSQMSTTFILQGKVMRKIGLVDAACMNNADALSVLFFGHVVGTWFYPALARRGIKLPTTQKFALGSFLGALAVAWALVVEGWITKEYQATGEKISILWQTVSYVLIGAGEIFAVSAAYEVAFTASSPERKVLASAVNLFCIGGLPNVFCIGLYNACKPWFRNSHGNANLSRVQDYASAQVERYFMLLFFLTMGGVLLNLLPSVRTMVESVEDRATELLKTPKTPKRPPIQRRRQEEAVTAAALQRAKRHRDYLKFGSGPQLFKLSSMRAGPSLSERKPLKTATRGDVQRLYRSTGTIPPSVGNVLPPSRNSSPISSVPGVSNSNSTAGGAQSRHHRSNSS